MKTVIITGTSTGIGFELAKIFSKKNYNVISLSRSSNVVKIGSKNIYLSIDNGRLSIADIASGKVSSILKIDNTIISRPFVLNQNIFVTKENAIIRLN